MCSQSSCDHIQWFQWLQLAIHHGYVTLVWCHMHWSSQKCLELMIISTNVMYKSSLRPLYKQKFYKEKVVDNNVKIINFKVCTSVNMMSTVLYWLVQLHSTSSLAHQYMMRRFHYTLVFYKYWSETLWRFVVVLYHHLFDFNLKGKSVEHKLLKSLWRAW